MMATFDQRMRRVEAEEALREKRAIQRMTDKELDAELARVTALLNKSSKLPPLKLGPDNSDLI